MDARNSVCTSRQRDTHSIAEDEEEETKKIDEKKNVFIVRDCLWGECVAPCELQ